MADDDQLSTDLLNTLETHETAVKRTIESFGDLEASFERTVAEFDDEKEVLDELEQFGKTLEAHERRLETLVETLNDHKGAVQNADDLSPEGLRAAMEKARRQARHESRPPGPDS